MIRDIMASFFRLPRWVQLWMVLWLMPINIASLWFWGADAPVNGALVALLANFGMAFNVPIVLRDRGFGNAMALPHLVLWTPLVVYLAYGVLQEGGSDGFRLFLGLLLVTDVISLAFDFKDGRDWWRGHRHVA